MTGNTSELRLTGEMLSEMEALWPQCGAGAFVATVDWDEHEVFVVAEPTEQLEDALRRAYAEDAIETWYAIDAVLREHGWMAALDTGGGYE